MRLPFTVVKCDSSAGGHSAANLHDKTPHSPGWVSSPFPHFPQELIIAFTGAVSIRSLKILSHPHYISSKIEVYVGVVPGQTPPNYKTAKYQFLGFVKFKGNEIGNQVSDGRQLQTIKIGTEGSFLKLVLGTPLLNSKNLCSQVGIADIAVEGDVHVNQSTRVLKTGQEGLDFQLLLQGIDLEEDFVHTEAKIAGVDTLAGRAIRDIKRLKIDCQDREDYDEAQRLNGLEKIVHDSGKQILELEAQKISAVEREDYPAAKDIKAEIERLMDTVQDSMAKARRRPRGEVPTMQQPSVPEEDDATALLERQIANLEAQKKVAVRDEDYALAKQLKLEIDSLRRQLEVEEEGSANPSFQPTGQPGGAVPPSPHVAQELFPTQPTPSQEELPRQSTRGSGRPPAIAQDVPLTGRSNRSQQPGSSPEKLAEIANAEGAEGDYPGSPLPPSLPPPSAQGSARGSGLGDTGTQPPPLSETLPQDNPESEAPLKREKVPRTP